MTDEKQATRSFFSEREQAQIAHAIDYAENYGDAGVPGHTQFLLIAKLFHMLEANLRHNTSEEN